MIPDQVIHDIRERTDIVALVSEYVRLKKRGSNYLGLCPFHNEKTPSFNVHAGRKFFHCFGCQASGDALGFLIRLEGLSFPQAARSLAERAGIEVPELDREESGQERRGRERRERLCAVMECATQFFERCRKEHPSAQVARDELARRQVTEETAAKFRLGYAPAGWDGLCGFLRDKDHALEDAEALGLVGRRRSGSGYYDRFRNRLQFPVLDASGQVVAFSGRILPTPPGEEERADQPKYINSPEGPLYRKGAVLFGIHQARVALRRVGWGVLCEGNFDLVALSQAGFAHTVAPLGTALTAEQAALLARYVERVTLLFDGDGAGKKAVAAAFPLLSKVGLAARVASLPPGEDPDSYLRAKGMDALQSLMDTAPGIVEFMIDSAAAAAAGQGAAAQALAIQGLAPVLAVVKNPVEIDLYVQRVAQKFQIGDAFAVRQQLRRGFADSRRSSRGHSPTPGEGPERSQPEPAPPIERLNLPELESNLFGLLLDQPTLFVSGNAKKFEELLTSSTLRGMFRTVAAHIQENGLVDASALLSQCTEDSVAVWLRERLVMSRYPDKTEAESTLDMGVAILEKQVIETELSDLARTIQEARRNGDEGRAIDLTRHRDSRAQALRAHRLVGRAGR